MKKLISIFLCLATLLCVMTAGGVTASAKTHKSGSYKYIVLKSGNVKITKYTGNKKKVVIPKKIKGRKVTVIGKKAFYGKKMTKLILNRNIRRIESCAFFNCKKLKKVTIPKTVKKIGIAAFGVYRGKEANLYNVSGFYIRGYLNSAAQKYAYGKADYDYNIIPFIALDYGIPEFTATTDKNKIAVSYNEVEKANVYQILLTSNGNSEKYGYMESGAATRIIENLPPGSYSVKMRAAMDVYTKERSDFFTYQQVYGKWSKPVTVIVE